MPTRKTIKRSIYDKAISSDDGAQGYDPDFSDLSFLAGSVGSNDMGFNGGDRGPWGIGESADDWRTNYERKMRLRRHTVEQGMSTFSFPNDAIRKLTGE